MFCKERLVGLVRKEVETVNERVDMSRVVGKEVDGQSRKVCKERSMGKEVDVEEWIWRIIAGKEVSM